MKPALIFFFVLTSLSMWFAAQETPPVICRGRPLPITTLPDPRIRGVALPLRFGGTREFPHLQFPSDKPFRLVIKNNDEFNVFWKRMYAEVPADLLPPPPEIDFSKEMVVVAAMGRRQSGYWIIIDGACEVDGQVEVFVSNVDASCAPQPGIGSAPADAVRLPQTDLPIVFRETQIGCTEWFNFLQRLKR